MKTSIAEILDGLDLTGEERTQVGAILANEKVRGRIDGELKNVQTEFSRSMDESRAAVAQAKADKDAYYTVNNEWKARQEETLKQWQEQSRKDREAAALLKARFDSLKGAGIISDEDIPDVAVPPPAPPPNTPPSPVSGPFVTQAEAMQMPRFMAMVSDMQAEHQSITGKPLANTGELVDEALKTGKPLREVWEAKYAIPKLKEEAVVKAQQEHDEKIRREERTKVLSEVSNPTSRAPGAVFQSPVLVAATKSQQNSIPNVGSRMGVERAMAAHAAGKYEGGVPHSTP